MNRGMYTFISRQTCFIILFYFVKVLVENVFYELQKVYAITNVYDKM